MRDHAWSASPWWGTPGGMWDTRVGRRTPDNHSTTAIERREIYKYIYICTICILYLRVCSWNGSRRRASGSWDFCAAASSRRECPSDSRHCHHIGLGRRTSTWNCCAARPGGRRWWYSLQLRLRAYREAPHCYWDLEGRERIRDIILYAAQMSFRSQLLRDFNSKSPRDYVFTFQADRAAHYINLGRMHALGVAPWSNNNNSCALAPAVACNLCFFFATCRLSSFLAASCCWLTYKMAAVVAGAGDSCPQHAVHLAIKGHS